MGWMITGKFPPILFIRNRNMPRTVVFTFSVETSTMVMKRMANQVSAVNMIMNEFEHLQSSINLLNNKGTKI